VFCERARARARAALRPAESNREAVRRYRSKPDKRERDRAVKKARRKALERLGLAHPEELDRYLTIERALLGLPPVGQS
jgi:hypothetical protein